MVGTYAAVLAVCVASLATGQAALALCGVRRWSWLSPAVGLALLLAVCWGTVRLSGEGSASVVAVLVLVGGSVAYLRGRIDGLGDALRVGAPVAVLVLAATALPFLAEGHFGILGTGFNPDMSQHLLAADRLADGETSQLLRQGYPLGPHAIVVALGKGLGVDLVDGFTGLTIAVALLSSLTALTAFRERPATLRTPAALVVGLAYLVASYFAQGAFKETMQALFFLAFVLALREASRNPEIKELPLRFVPAALLAVGTVYAYSFPGLTWLIGTAAIWAIAQYAVGPMGGSAGGADAEGPRTEAKPPPAGSFAAVTGSAAWRAALYAVLLFAVLIAPELGRLIDFHNFETFDPNGPGLGNLFGQVSPFEALGIWPSGDFRLSPGDGAVPALGYYLGASFASILLCYGLVLAWCDRDRVPAAAVAASAAIYALTRFGGTPYTSAKALVVPASVLALAIVLPLLRRPVAWLYMVAAGGCALLALANAPVGPGSYSPALTGLRSSVGMGPTLVLASRHLLEDEHGRPYIAWELRGGRVCIEASDEAGAQPPPGVRYVVTALDVPGPPFPGLQPERVAPPYLLWQVAHPATGRSPCPLIAVRQTRQGSPR